MANLADMFAVATSEGGSREYLYDYAYCNYSDHESWNVTNLPPKWDALLNNQVGSE